MPNAPITKALPRYDEAINIALAQVTALDQTETLRLRDCVDRVLAKPVKADRDLPPFNRSALDGYALNAHAFSANRTWPVVGTIAAGAEPGPAVPSDACVAIATGAPLPAGLNVVIAHERSDRGDRSGKPVTFSVDAVEAGQGVHQRGADANEGDMLIESHVVIGPQHIGLAATVGVDQMEVVCKPTAHVITTGDEVVMPPIQPAPHQIRNSNGPQTSALLHDMGADVVSHEHLADDFETVMRALEKATSTSHLVITVGGVSAGDRDHVPGALAQLGMKTLIKGCAMQPGRPVLIGQCGKSLVVGLPGNPVSALVCSTLFIWPLIRQLLGLQPELPWRNVRLDTDVKPNAKRQAFRPARVNGNTAHVPPWAGSGDLSHTAQTNGVVALPRQTEMMTEGMMLPFVAWPSMR